MPDAFNYPPQGNDVTCPPSFFIQSPAVREIDHHPQLLPTSLCSALEPLSALRNVYANRAR